MLIVDGGSVLSRREYAREVTDETSFRAMVRMGYVAGTIGMTDLALGPKYLLDRVKGSGFTLVSANVYDEATGKLVVQPYIVVERAGIKFAITGVLDPKTKIPTDRDVESPGVTVADPKEKLLELVPLLRKKAAFVILLCSTELEPAKEIAIAVPGIDFLVVGNFTAQSEKSFTTGGATFLQPGSRGQYMCDYRVAFDEKQQYLGCEGQAVALGDNVPADASMALVMKEYKTAVDEMNKATAALRAKEQQEVTRKAEAYREACIGVNSSCKRCHQLQYEQWMETAHATAFETLEKSVQSTNPACLECHTTCELNLPDDGSQPVPEHLRSVQCEACHGIGTNHARDGSYGTVDTNKCLVCHDKENSPNFDLATYLPMVTH
jgi:hypothetical protein